MLKLKGFWRPGHLLAQDIWSLLQQESSLHYDCQNKILPGGVINVHALLCKAEIKTLCLYFSGCNFENRAEENQTLALPVLRG